MDRLYTSEIMNFFYHVTSDTSDFLGKFLPPNLQNRAVVIFTIKFKNLFSEKGTFV